jgi:hypothetical protein
LVEILFLSAPALCWWALTMVASIMAYSLSGSSAKALKRLSQIYGLYAEPADAGVSATVQGSPGQAA